MGRYGPFEIDANLISGEELHRLQLAREGIPSVGAIAVATRRTGVCDVGERGVCYEVYGRTWAKLEEAGEHGYSFIFERGRYDGFSLDEVRQALTLTGEVVRSVMDYGFTNVLLLERDFRGGRFREAFPKC